jgi:hypothetical protein
MMLGRTIKTVSFSDPKKIGLKAVKTRLFAKSKLERKVLFFDERLTYHDCSEFLVDFNLKNLYKMLMLLKVEEFSLDVFIRLQMGNVLSYLLIL